MVVEESQALIRKRTSSILKGIGILLMLFHHLFYSEPSQALYNDLTIHGINVVNEIGIFCKLCVAVFVFVSGYGLAASTPPDQSLKAFYCRRFKKLYLHYWFIWLIFIPITVFVFGRSFNDAYGENAIVKGILDFFGLLSAVGYDSYNPTWWFYSCIIILYLLFPLLNKFLTRATYLIVSIAVTIVLAASVPGINVISGYLFVFVVGMLMSHVPRNVFDRTRVWQIVLAFFLLSVWRLAASSPKHIVDGLLCMGMALFFVKVPLNNWLGRVFEELGKHSMNMFLIHTFIYCFWFEKYIYITRNPVLIFMSLLLSSYLFSVVLEWIKRKIGFYRFFRL